MTAHSSLTRTEVLDILRATADQAGTLGAGFSWQHLNTRPAPGEWSMAEIVGHLVLQEEKVLLPRLRRMVAENAPVFGSSQGLADSPAPSSFASEIVRFRDLRSRTVALLDSLSDAAWQRQGWRPSRPDPITIEVYARYAAEHDLDHLQQLGTTAAIIGC